MSIRYLYNTTRVHARAILYITSWLLFNQHTNIYSTLTKLCQIEVSHGR